MVVAGDLPGWDIELDLIYIFNVGNSFLNGLTDLMSKLVT